MGGAARHSSLPTVAAAVLAVVAVSIVGAVGARRLWRSDCASRAQDLGGGGAEGN
jgi:hypothetical protein